ncbi:hypothetical protein E2C01_008471 [Portunus trituberculatus]|uniref:Uncharacterized protein n=1 Tax=Portunus trituberculatus TaxID=210409 RepID=A0A5B7D0V6_PORTR|nr:hypothetical protein [Portunus trituberculatus]
MNGVSSPCLPHFSSGAKQMAVSNCAPCLLNTCGRLLVKQGRPQWSGTLEPEVGHVKPQCPPPPVVGGHGAFGSQRRGCGCSIGAVALTLHRQTRGENCWVEGWGHSVHESPIFLHVVGLWGYCQLETDRVQQER